MHESISVYAMFFDPRIAQDKKLMKHMFNYWKQQNLKVLDFGWIIGIDFEVAFFI